MADFGTFEVQEIIMHGIPRGSRSADAADADFSEAIIDLEARVKGYITLKLRGTLGDRARPVIEDQSIGSQVPHLIRELLNGKGDLVATSQELARSLHQAQKWMSSPGLVMVVLGKIDGDDCLVVAKMEHHEGMRVQPTVTETGLRTFLAEHLTDLILGEGTKVFKAGIFTASAAGAGSILSGMVADDQLSGQHVAAYFVHFLGCDFVQRPDVMTETFFNEAHRVIGRVAKDNPTLRANYEMALIVEMQSASGYISPANFAIQHLNEEHREAFAARMNEVGLTARRIPKDVTLIAPNIRRMKMQTSRGATILVPPEMHDDGSLKVEKIKGERQKTQITLIDEIVNIVGAGGPRSKSTVTSRTSDQ